MPVICAAARGRICSCASAPSVRNSCMPPTRSMGRTASAVMTMPMPPSHCSSARHKQQSVRRLVEPGDHRRTGRGDARHRLEERVGVAEAELRERHRHGAEHRGHDPAQGRHDEGLAQIHAVALHAVGQHQTAADEEREERREREGLPVGMAGRGVDHARQGHQDAKRRDQDAADIQHRPKVDHGRRRSRAAEAGHARCARSRGRHTLGSWRLAGSPSIARNSRRVDALSRKMPSMVLVTMVTPGLWMPRVVMH